MTSLRDQLLIDAAPFLARVQSTGPADTARSVDEALMHLIEWSAERATALVRRPAEGVDPLVGVARQLDTPFIWRAYPRQRDGGKVCLFPQAAVQLPADGRQEIIRVIEALEPGRRVEDGQELEVGLPRIASAAGWSQFCHALAIAFTARRRSVPRAP